MHFVFLNLIISWNSWLELWKNRSLVTIHVLPNTHHNWHFCPPKIITTDMLLRPANLKQSNFSIILWQFLLYGQYFKKIITFYLIDHNKFIFVIYCFLLMNCWRIKFAFKTAILPTPTFNLEDLYLYVMLSWVYFQKVLFLILQDKKQKFPKKKL